MARRRTDPLLDRALLEADLKLGGQGSALRELLGQARGEYIRTRRVNASNARAIQASTMAAAPAMSKAFDQALESVAAQRQALGYGGPGDVQAQAYARRVGQQKANALADLVGQAQRAEAGRVYAGDVARSEYLGTKRKIVGQLGDLAREQGATAQSAYGRLRDEQLARGIKRRGQDITSRGQDIAKAQAQQRLTETARHNRAVESRSGSRGDGPRWVSPVAHARAKDSIDEARQWVSRLLQGNSSATVRDLMLAGGEVPVEGQVDPVKVPRFSKDYINAAFDLQVKGGLSQANVDALHRRGLKIRTLGYDRAPRRPAGPAAGTVGPARRGAGG